MSSFTRRIGWVALSTLSAAACGGQGSGLGPTAVSAVGPREAAADVNGVWRGSFTEEARESEFRRATRGGTVRMTLRQSGDSVAGQGESRGSTCLPARYTVAGTVSGTSVVLTLADEAKAGAVARAAGSVEGAAFYAAYSNSRVGCADVDATFSLNRD